MNRREMMGAVVGAAAASNLPASTACQYMIFEDMGKLAKWCFWEGVAPANPHKFKLTNYHQNIVVRLDGSEAVIIGCSAHVRLPDVWYMSKVGDPTDWDYTD